MAEPGADSRDSQPNAESEASPRVKSKLQSGKFHPSHNEKPNSSSNPLTDPVFLMMASGQIKSAEVLEKERLILIPGIKLQKLVL